MPHEEGLARPFISVVIASVNGTPYIIECLEHLTRQQGEIPFEVLLMDCCDEQTRVAIRSGFPQPEVVLVEVEGRPSIPKLRAMGMDRAKGRMVAILEDHCNVPPDWFSVIERAHKEGHQAIGGAVENGATGRLVNWAVFFTEYAPFMRPLTTGDVPSIAGSSAIYDRQAIDRVEPEHYHEVWEYWMHQRLKEQGVRFYCPKDLWVSHKKDFDYWYFMSQRYHYSRSFAGARMHSEAFLERLAYAGAAVVLLPPLLMWRMFKTVWGKGTHRGTFLLASPIIGTFLLSYGWGEAIGAIFGPGESLARVE